jgi:hypothetical protein
MVLAIDAFHGAGRTAAASGLVMVISLSMAVRPETGG